MRGADDASSTLCVFSEAAAVPSSTTLGLLGWKVDLSLAAD